MRRGINDRKKKRIIAKNINKKALTVISILSILIIICLVLYFFFIQNIFIKKNLEKDSSDFSSLNENIPFSLNKIILFHGATAETGSVNNYMTLNISNYCDIGMYLNNLDKENTSIKSLYIDNIKISTPEVGTPYLYKKRVTDLGNCSFSDENIIQDNFYFNIIETPNTLNFDNYELSNDGTTPISIGFYNKNIKEDFITDKSEILYNGTLLKDALIPQSSLNCNISFSINIITNEDEHYMCNVNFDIPFEDKDGSIYDTGYATQEFNSSQTGSFIRLK